MSFEIGTSELSSFVLLQDWFCGSESLEFPNEFQKLVSFFREVTGGFGGLCVEFADDFG